jgi:queuine tRNA-ribosyltransferase
MVCLDDCPPYGFVEKEIKSSVERTLKWAKRCHVEYIKQIKKRKLDEKSRPKLIAVIQGGLSKEFRKKCLDGLLEISQEKVLGECIPFAGYGFGARPVDENGNFLFDILDYTAKIIPDGKIKFALGIGTPSDIVRCQKMGWNMFDCVIPTREGRHGKIFKFARKKSLNGKFYQELNVKNFAFSTNFNKINIDSSFYDLKTNSLSYLNHLFKINEALGQRLASLNNLEFYSSLINVLRKK